MNLPERKSSFMSINMQLLYDEFDNVEVCPWRIKRVNEQAFIQGGIVSPSKLPDFARHYRGKRIADCDSNPLSQLPKLVGKHIWGGCYHEHFGHFIAEFVHRLWVASLPEYKDVPVIFTAQKADYKLHSTFEDLMGYFGIANWKILTAPAEIETLIIAEQGSHLNATTKPAYTEWLLTRSTAKQMKNEQSPDKICILRGHNTGGRLLLEQQLEEVLVERGYTAIRPEKLPLAKQLELLFNAQKIVFSEGSALHLFDLLPKCSTEVAVINRRPNTILANTTLSGKVKRFTIMPEASIVYVPTVSGKKDPNKALSYIPIQDIVSFLEVKEFISLSSKLDLKSSEEALKRDFQLYLSSNQFKKGDQPVIELLFKELARRFKQNRALNTEVTLLKAQAAIKDEQYAKAKLLVDQYLWLDPESEVSNELRIALKKVQPPI